MIQRLEPTNSSREESNSTRSSLSFGEKATSGEKPKHSLPPKPGAYARERNVESVLGKLLSSSSTYPTVKCARAADVVGTWPAS